MGSLNAKNVWLLVSCIVALGPHPQITCRIGRSATWPNLDSSRDRSHGEGKCGQGEDW